jgi:hypothetical protein
MTAKDVNIPQANCDFIHARRLAAVSGDNRIFIYEPSSTGRIENRPVFVFPAATTATGNCPAAAMTR